MDWESLLPYCSTEGQRRKVEAIMYHGGIRAAARALGTHHTAIIRTVQVLKRRAAKSDRLQHIEDVPDGYKIKGCSTLYDGEGNPRLQWVKTNVDAEAMEKAMREAVEAFAADLPRAKPAKPTIGARYLKSLCALYAITDFHLGMYAWSEETGDDWDTSIARNLLVRWFEQAAGMAPQAETGLLAVMGDFLHWDGLDSVTPTNHHVLDADTRFQHVVRTAIACLRQAVSILLQRHKRVHIVLCEGNHDMASSVWLREFLAAFYEAEPRVQVDTSPRPFYCHEHGKTAIYFHHGHLKKMDALDRVLAGMFPETFGRCSHRYTHTGHLHHDRVIETPLMKIEQHRTLAAPDAYAARGGWISGRDAKCIIYHRDHGEVMRLTIGPGALQ